MKGLTVRVLKMHPLWGEALPQVQLGWLIDPIRFDNSGMAQGFSLWGGGPILPFASESSKMKNLEHSAA